MKEIYRIADRIICIDAMYSKVHKLCAEYKADGIYIQADNINVQNAVSDYVPNTVPLPVDFTVQIRQADIDNERIRSAREKIPEGPNDHIRTGSGCEKPSEGQQTALSDAYLETLAVYRKIAEKMPDYDTVLMHGSCVAVDDAGYLFAAKSGTGKSTHTRLWRELLGDRAVMVNDDKPMIRMTDDGAVIYGTPWDGKHRLSTNIAVPLRAICILKRAEENTIVPISAIDAYPMLVQQIYRPADTEALKKTLTLIDKLAHNVSFWQLSCSISREAAQIAYQAMSGTTL